MHVAQVARDKERHDLPSAIGQGAIADRHAFLEQEHRSWRHALADDVHVGLKMLVVSREAVEDPVVGPR